jgi:serine/threonine protein kinase/tetratricopeptide (TPR) repeat protein
MTVAPGTQLGRYEIRSQIGAGGMGEVYLADDTLLRRKVALKLLPADVAPNRERLGRFEQEAFTASALNHPNIVTVFEIGEADSVRFIATEYIDGETLRRRMARARVNLREALDVAVQVASALAAAHKAGVVHRDIKPENIMIRHDDGIVKVLDFGLAKATERLVQPSTDPEAPTRAQVNTSPGVVMGTANYMSPEQARGLQIDPRTDIWSLGVVLYEMVAGRLPFEGETASDVVSTILHKEPPALTRLSDEATERLDEIVTKTLAKDREERYQVAKDLLIDLKRLKQHLDFESEVERTFAPELRSSTTAQPSSALAERSAAQTAAVSGAVSTGASSAEYIVREIKRHQKGALVVALVAVAITATAIYLYSRRVAPLTEKDTIVLSDFVNTTGDAVFDQTLKQALAVQLGQSPFLNIFSDQQIRDALRFMGRSPDERVTKDVAREICERQGLKAMLAGSISSLGGHYVITLEALNGHTGEAIAREQAEAENKEQVLKKLGEAATKLREKLGESLSSIQKFDAPIEQATTSSLEALKAFSLGDEQRAKGNYAAAIPFYKRAIELDPNFALAYSRTAVMYFNVSQLELAAQLSEKAFALRDRVSEREKLYIESRYYGDVVGDRDKYTELLELWKRTYPRDFVPPNNLALAHNFIGQYEKAVEEAQEAIGLNPNNAAAYANLARAFLSLNRLDEGRAVIEQALGQKLDSTSYHNLLYSVAFIRGDTAAMQQQVEWAAGKQGEENLVNLQAQAAISLGQWRKAREFSNRAVDLAQRRDFQETAAWYASGIALAESALGNCQQAKQDATNGLSLVHSRISLSNAALALAMCGEAGQAQPLIDELARRFPKDSYLNVTWLPATRAALEVNRNNAAQAIQLLQTASLYEIGIDAGLWPAYIRGLALLRQRSGTEAMADFQKILDHRGVVATSPLYPLAHLGLGRAAVLQGDTAKARKAYQDFFALWKDADPDIPILSEAKKEYEKLR